jgi:hypothetical protein
MRHHHHHQLGLRRVVGGSRLQSSRAITIRATTNGSTWWRWAANTITTGADEMRRTGRVADVPLSDEGRRHAGFPFECCVQPYWSFRRCGRGGMQGAVPGGRDAALPDAQFCVPGGRSGMGVRSLQRSDRESLLCSGRRSRTRTIRSAREMAAPHLPQKFEVGAFSAPHIMQRRSTGASMPWGLISRCSPPCITAVTVSPSETAMTLAGETSASAAPGATQVRKPKRRTKNVNDADTRCMLPPPASLDWISDIGMINSLSHIPSSRWSHHSL